MDNKKVDMPAIQLKAFDDLIASYPEIERKGKTMPYTSLNGHMFSHLSKEGVMGLRLSEKDRSSFLSEYQSQIFVQHGREMKEYVEIPNSLLIDTNALRPYLIKSLEYIKTLKPK